MKTVRHPHIPRAIAALALAAGLALPITALALPAVQRDAGGSVALPAVQAGWLQALLAQWSAWREAFAG